MQTPLLVAAALGALLAGCRATTVRTGVMLREGERVELEALGRRPSVLLSNVGPGSVLTQVSAPDAAIEPRELVRGSLSWTQAGPLRVVVTALDGGWTLVRFEVEDAEGVSMDAVQRAGRVAPDAERE